MRTGTLTSEALVRSCLDRIASRDPDVKAWLYLDPDYALRQACEIDKRPVIHPMHGLPFGVKDIMDTADMPTTQNTAFYQGHRPAKDAAFVAVVRHFGSVILGKTDTVEYASNGRKAATRNPFNFAHTPGGSSSGSGAAVGDFQVPLAFGTRTAGSNIHPASFNGIYGLKPSWGVVSRDPVSVRGLRVALCQSPNWSKAESSAQQAFALADERLAKAGAVVSDLTLPSAFDGMYEAQRVVMMGEGRASFLPEMLVHGAALHQHFHDRANNSTGITPEKLIAAYDLAAACRVQFDALFSDFDVMLTPAATGEAPEGLHTSGDHIFNAMWTLLHTPCLAIPCTSGAKGLPVGIQIVGPRFSDARLMRIGAAVAPFIDVEERAVIGKAT